MRRWQTNFIAGEVSRQASARFDANFYGSAAELLENLFVKLEGGVVRAGAGRHAAAPKHHDRRCRLIPFKKSNEDVVVIEAGDNYFRYHDAKTLADLGQETATAFDLPSVDALYWFQSADVMFLTVKTGALQPKALRRFADNNWSLIDYDCREGPFLPETIDGGAITVSNVTGNVTVSGFGSFAAGHVGARFRLFEPLGGKPYKAWQSEEGKEKDSNADDVQNGELREHEGRVYRANPGGVCTNQPPIHESGTVLDGGTVGWEYLHELAGVLKITGVNGPSLATAIVESYIPKTTTAKWAEGFFSNARGWPFVGGIFQSRLYFAGAPQFPDTLWGSRIDGFNQSYCDFKQSAGSGEVVDDDAVVRTLNDSEVNRIAWMLTGEQILLGHAGGVVRVTGPSINEPITPAGASAVRPEPPPGAYFNARAVRAGDAVIYATTSGRKVVALNPADFSFQTLTARCRDKGAARFKEFAYAGETEARLYALREDGRLFACAYDREQNVVAWSTLVPGGTYQGGAPPVESICVVPGADGRDRLWYVVMRTIDGQTRRAIEVMDPDFDADETPPEAGGIADGAVVVDRWNKDPAKTISISGGTLRDQAVTLTATGFSFAAGDVGAVYHLRRRLAPVAEVRIDAQAGATATGVLLADLPPGFAPSLRFEQWAIASSAISGLAHLEGETVGVWGDAADLGNFTVEGGAIVLPEPVAYAVAGLRKAWRGRSLPFIAELADGISKGKPLAVQKGYVELIDTATENARVTTIADGVRSNVVVVGARNSDDLMPTAPPLRSGTFRVPFASGHATRFQVEVSGDGMGPANFLAIGVEYGD